jgi:hypothetical protein
VTTETKTRQTKEQFSSSNSRRRISLKPKLELESNKERNIESLLSTEN